jgi:hypothetical protein
VPSGFSGEELLKLRKYLRRTGCALLLVIWFMLLLTPCLLFTLAAEREMVFTYSDIPNDNLRIWLIQDAKNRGVAISNSRRVHLDNGTVCTVIDGRFILWQGSAEPPHYCSCYTRPDQDSMWSSVAEGEEACKLAGG